MHLLNTQPSSRSWRSTGISFGPGSYEHSHSPVDLDENISTAHDFGGLGGSIFGLSAQFSISKVYRLAAVVKFRESIKLRPEARSKSVHVAPSSYGASRALFISWPGPPGSYSEKALRYECSASNEHWFRMNCVRSPQCVCGYRKESVKHFLLHWPRFVAQRNILLTSVSQILGSTIARPNDGLVCRCLLQGSSTLSFTQNIKLFAPVQTFILDSGPSASAINMAWVKRCTSHEPNSINTAYCHLLCNLSVLCNVNDVSSLDEHGRCSWRKHVAIILFNPFSPKLKKYILPTF